MPGAATPADGLRFAGQVDALLEEVIRSSGLALTYSLRLKGAGSIPLLVVEFSGNDTPALLARNAELLLALEHIAAKTLRFEDEQHEWISFDAGGFKAARERRLHREAARAVEQVKTTGRPYAFPPMNSRERRLLHLALASSGLRTASEGEGAARRLVVFPQLQRVIR